MSNLTNGTAVQDPYPGWGLFANMMVASLFFIIMTIVLQLVDLRAKGRKKMRFMVRIVDIPFVYPLSFAMSCTNVSIKGRGPRHFLTPMSPSLNHRHFK